MVNADINPAACMEFEADVYLLFHNNYLCKGFQTVIHVGNVCQTAKIVKMNKVLYLQFHRTCATFMSVVNNNVTNYFGVVHLVLPSVSLFFFRVVCGPMKKL